MNYTDDHVFNELVIFMFHHSDLQYSIELEQINLNEDELLIFFKNLSRCGGVFHTQPVHGLYKIIGFYETTQKGVTVSIPFKDGNVSKTKKYFYSWEMVVKGIMKILSSMFKQLQLF